MTSKNEMEIFDINKKQFTLFTDFCIIQNIKNKKCVWKFMMKNSLLLRVSFLALLGQSLSYGSNNNSDLELEIAEGASSSISAGRLDSVSVAGNQMGYGYGPGDIPVSRLNSVSVAGNQYGYSSGYGYYSPSADPFLQQESYGYFSGSNNSCNNPRCSWNSGYSTSPRTSLQLTQQDVQTMFDESADTGLKLLEKYSNNSERDLALQTDKLYALKENFLFLSYLYSINSLVQQERPDAARSLVRNLTHLSCRLDDEYYMSIFNAYFEKITYHKHHYEYQRQYKEKINNFFMKDPSKSQENCISQIVSGYLGTSLDLSALFQNLYQNKTHLTSHIFDYSIIHLLKNPHNSFLFILENQSNMFEKITLSLLQVILPKFKRGTQEYKNFLFLKLCHKFLLDYYGSRTITTTKNAIFNTLKTYFCAEGEPILEILFTINKWVDVDRQIQEKVPENRLYLYQNIKHISALLNEAFIITKDYLLEINNIPKHPSFYCQGPNSELYQNMIKRYFIQKERLAPFPDIEALLKDFLIKKLQERHQAMKEIEEDIEYINSLIK